MDYEPVTRCPRPLRSSPQGKSIHEGCYTTMMGYAVLCEENLARPLCNSVVRRGHLDPMVIFPTRPLLGCPLVVLLSLLGSQAHGELGREQVGEQLLRVREADREKRVGRRPPALGRSCCISCTKVLLNEGLATAG